MDLNNLSKEVLINELKHFMVKCINTFSVEIIKLGKRNKFIFTKGEYYFIDENEGGVWIKHDSGEWFDWHDEKYINTFERSFINS